MIKINVETAKIISHEKRRVARAEEFAPLDEQIAKQIPGVDYEAIEAERQVIRDKYATMQEDIDAATTVEELLEALVA